MSFSTAVGQSWKVDGREAGLEATQQALDMLGRSRIAFAWVVSSYIYPSQQVLAGVNDLLADIPVLGLSTSAELTQAGRSQRSAAVILFASQELQARAGWWPDFVQDSRACTQSMLSALQPNGDAAETLLVVADGISGDVDYLCQTVSEAGFGLAGCLAGGDVGRGRTYQMGGRQSGSGGLAAAVLSGDAVVGVGAAHGWRPVGALARLTRVQGNWVRTIDDQPASHLYARYFGYAAREWAFSPLNDLVRLYPLVMEEDGAAVVRSPLRVEADGSLRMNSKLPEGKIVDLMVGSREDCWQAARRATEQAMRALGSARPKGALVLADVAWQTLLDLQPGSEILAVREILGSDVPILGGYTLGQVARLAPDNLTPDGVAPKGAVHFFNSHIEVILFGEKKVEAGGAVA